MTLVLTDTFQKALARLDRPDQTAIKNAVYDFHTQPPVPGANLHPIQAARDARMYSFRVNQDIRVIVNQQGADTVLCYVDHHDSAYAWAQRHTFEKNSVTGSAQMLEVTEAVREVVRTREVVSVFGHHPESYLLGLGVPPEWLVPVMSVDDEGALDLLQRLPEAPRERLLSLLAGDPVPLPVAADGASPFTHPDAQSTFRIVDSQSELRLALNAPWDEWIVFLHPDQRALVETSQSGPALVTGSAGTGKSVVAVHRAVRMATEGSGRVLLTSYSRTLAQRLKEHAERLLPAGEAAWERLEVANVHTVARRLVADSGRSFAIVSPKQLEQFITDATRRTGSQYTARFVTAEWEALVDPWGIDTWDAYLEAPRAGRGTPLGARQRRDLWTVFEAVLAELADGALMTWSQVTRAAARTAEGSGMFAHVLADECQDYGPAELAVLRSLVSTGPDDLMLCGDGGQQIYQRGYSWLQAGIDVRGRSRRLKVNYRTTEQIRRWADSLLPGEVAQPDGDSQSRHSVSLLSGPAPEIVGAETVARESEIVSEWIEARLAEGLVPGDIAIFARKHQLLESRAESALARLGRSGRPLKDDSAPSPDHVGLGTMHNAKGLEFRAVAVIGCEDGVVPLTAALQLEDIADRESAEQQERNLLYVACTRAQRRLLVTFVGKPSPYLPTPSG